MCLFDRGHELNWILIFLMIPGLMEVPSPSTVKMSHIMAGLLLLFLFFYVYNGHSLDSGCFQRFNGSMAVGRSMLWHKVQEKHISRLIKWPGCLATQQCLSIVNLHSKKVNEWRDNLMRIQKTVCREGDSRACVITLLQCRLISGDNGFLVFSQLCVIVLLVIRRSESAYWEISRLFTGKCLSGDHQMDERCTHVENIQFQEWRGGL